MEINYSFLPNNFIEVKKSLLEQISVLDTQFSNTKELGGEIRALVVDFMYELSEKGWVRRDIHYLILELTENTQELSEEAIEQLSEYRTGITAYCADECIIKFAGEPDDKEDFLNYVKRGDWQK